MAEPSRETLAERPAVACGSSLFGASVLEDRIAAANDGGLLDFVESAEWALDGPLARPMGDRELAPAIAEMAAATRPADTWEANYVRRASILAIHILESARWPRPQREAAAWASLVVGLDHHEFQPRRASGAFDILRPPLDFFTIHGTVESLTAAVLRCFSHAPAAVRR